MKELYRAYGFRDVGEELLSRLGLPGYGDRVVQSLSRGEQARVLIALACQSDADALILDEPAGNLNEENKANLEERFFKITGTYEKRLFEDYVAQEQEEMRPDMPASDDNADGGER